MPENEMEKRMRLLESAVDLSRFRSQPTVRPSLGQKFELAEKNVDRIVRSGALSKEEAKKFSLIADSAIRDSMRESLRGGAGELAATINVTVAGTGTISVS